MTHNGRVRYELKTPWRNGTTDVIFEPLDFMYRMYVRYVAGAWMRRSDHFRAGFVKTIASIEDPTVIQKILAHLDDNATSAAPGLLPECRVPPSPPMSLFV